LFARLTDWLFGYDFFISYAHGDGLNYPTLLEKLLKGLGYKVFLDKNDYVAGIDLNQATRRRVRMSRKLIVVARPLAFESHWIKRELDIYLEMGRTPILININSALETARNDAPLSQLATQNHWLRVEEHLPHVDDAPTKKCIDDLNRSFDATRQETIRVRFFQGATVAFAALAAVAVWQAWRATEQRDLALQSQSRVMAALADQRTDEITAVNAIPLALEALPDPSAGIVRPYTPEAEAALYKALFVRRDYATLHSTNSKGKALTVGLARLSDEGRKTMTLGTLLASDRPKIWDTETGNLLTVINEEMADDLGSRFVSSGSQVLTTSSVAGEARLWKSDTGQRVASYKCPQEFQKLTSFDVSQDRKFALLGCDGRLLRLVEIDGTAERDLFHFDHQLRSAFFSFDGQHIVATQEDNFVRILQTSDGEEQFSIQENARSKVAGILSPDNLLLATFPFEEDDGSQLILRERQTSRIIASVPASLNFGIFRGTRGIFDPAGQLFLVISPKPQSTVRVLRTKDGTEAVSLKGHDDHVMSALFSADGRRIITASEDHTARIWDTKSGRELATLKAHNWPVLLADISDDGAWIVTSTAGNGNEARIWRSQVRPGFPVEDCHQNWSISSASFDAEGKRLVTSGGSIACVWDVSSSKLIARFDQHQYGITTASFSPDGRHVVTSSDDKTAAIWSASTGELYRRLAGHTGNVASAAFSPDGKRVLTASQDTTAQLWDAQTGDRLPITLHHPTWLRQAAFSADGKRILSVASKNIYLWDAATGADLQVLENSDEVRYATFSPDGRYIAAAIGDGGGDSGYSLGIWDLVTKKSILTIPHDDQIWHISFSPGGSRIATASDAIRVWDLAAQTPVAVIKDGDAPYTWAEFNRGGNKLVAVTSGSVGLWPQFEKPQDIVGVAKKTLTRCLTPRERSIFKLDLTPPPWCVGAHGQQ
jgi:WD40 repeat protein